MSKKHKVNNDPIMFVEVPGPKGPKYVKKNYKVLKEPKRFQKVPKGPIKSVKVPDCSLRPQKVQKCLRRFKNVSAISEKVPIILKRSKQV